MKTPESDKIKLALSISSGLLLTGSFPNVNFSWLAWFAFVPLFISLRDLSWKKSFLLGFCTGLTHYFTLIYWLIHTMRTYGHLPWHLSVMVLILFSAYLALYFAVFSATISRLLVKPSVLFLMLPVFWVGLEYIRSFFLSGFPWELIGYSQFNQLHILQISDIFGVYGVSFLVVLSNAAIFIGFLFLSGLKWQDTKITIKLALFSISLFLFIFIIVWSYGALRIESIDRLVANSSSKRVTIVQGNIKQSEKWDQAFQLATIKKYIDLSHAAKGQKTDLVVWPETAAPFYFLKDTKLSQMIIKGIADIPADFVIGSPCYDRRNHKVEYYNSAYLISSAGHVYGRYDKAHLVPFGEYVPLKRWLPFLGKIVEHVGDFRPGKKGDTLQWNTHKLGFLICYEIIFPDLSRAMAKNRAALLVNITNDAWYGRTGAPYQHFSKAVFRAVENRRALVRSANTGISGFIDPVGRVTDSTELFQDAVRTDSVPLITETSFYTRFGDWFAICCMGLLLLVILANLMRNAGKK
ncbi:MAG: apolipoprotein N-acyltransferase [Thermodesulfobacteriota bacterium]|nr:apolipoprotein N-acyltransferase [Thermodesulfobacteriota bacterium]